MPSARHRATRSGFEVLAWIRSHGAAAKTVVVMHSSSEDPEHIRLSFRKGAHGFVSKGQLPRMLKEARPDLAARLPLEDMPDTQIVAYDADVGMYAARLWWMLRWLGHEAVAVLVLGYPRRLSGEANAQTAAVQQIAERLKTVIGIPIVLQDERLTSHEAEERLSRMEKDWRKRKLLLDAMSAAVILQDYLDRAAERRGTANEDEGT